MLLTDLHIHSTFSDGKLTIPQIVDLYGKAGFDVIAITDHLCEEGHFLGKAAKFLNFTLTRENFPLYIKTIREEASRAMDLYGMILIPGFELTRNYVRPYKASHILALGVESYIPADDDPYILARRIKEEGGFSVAAHPFFTQKIEPCTIELWLRREEMAEVLDAWEVGNGSNFSHKIMRSGLPIIANSDFHSYYQLSSWKTVVYSRKEEGAMFKAIKRQEIDVLFYQAGVPNPLENICNYTGSWGNAFKSA